MQAITQTARSLSRRAVRSAMLLMLCASPHVAADEPVAASTPAELTPLGAERAGNAEGSIPAWQEGVAVPVDCADAAEGAICTPGGGEQALYIVDAANREL
jgi:hypothetical protein